MDGPSWGAWPVGGAWLSTHLWEHFLFNGDTAFLREYYPIIKDQVRFQMDILVEAGLSPLEALESATSLPASVFGLTDRGRIDVGLRADLLLVDGDPTTDIDKTRNIVAIWKEGEMFDRDFYREKKELVKE